MRKNMFTTKRLVFDALLVALYVTLGFLKIPIGNVLRINMASFSVVVCAVAFGPVDGLLVGLLGEFLSQVLGPYGLTPTTLLWALPEAVRGLSLGLLVWWLTNKGTARLPMKGKRFAMFLAACVFTGIAASLLNTFALYVDSKMFGYYNDYMVFGALALRLTMAVIMSGAFGSVSCPIVAALRKNKMI